MSSYLFQSRPISNELSRVQFSSFQRRRIMWTFLKLMWHVAGKWCRVDPVKVRRRKQLYVGPEVKVAAVQSAWLYGDCTSCDKRTDGRTDATISRRENAAFGVCPASHHIRDQGPGVNGQPTSGEWWPKWPCDAAGNSNHGSRNVALWGLATATRSTRPRIPSGVAKSTTSQLLLAAVRTEMSPLRVTLRDPIWHVRLAWSGGWRPPCT